jgi:hypothetical protein
MILNDLMACSESNTAWLLGDMIWFCFDKSMEERN